MKPIDDPRFAEAVRLFEQEHEHRSSARNAVTPDFSWLAANRADNAQRAAFAAKPSPQTHYRTMANLRTAVFARLDAKTIDSRRSTL